MTDPRSRFHIHASNRLEILADRLAEKMAFQPGDPLTAERIVVPHPVLGRWLRLALASRLGIAAHLRTQLPAEFAWSTMRETMPELSAGQGFSPSRLRWRIFETLQHWQEDDPLRSYLADGDPRKRFELAARLAQVYDRCLLYRPAWIRAWQAGETPHWQARLWNRLAVADGERHWVDAIDSYRQHLSGSAVNSPAEGRASFFAVASLSPSYLEWLRSAAAKMDIHLFLLSPCCEFWADIRAPHGVVYADAGDEYALGNELLAAWGKPARDMQALLADDLGAGTPEEIYAEPPLPTRLAAVQRDMLHLRTIDEGRAAADSGAATDDGAVDHSIQIHVCHSATREAEVLHDRLLGLFDAHQDIQPADVLLLTPNLDEYAPVVEAVFSSAGVVPLDVARQQRPDSAAVQAFLDLLALPDSRYGVHAVLAPLRAASSRAQFALDEGDLAVLRGWLDRAGIRWGIDEAHLREEGVPTASHTWRAGLRRLLLGYAMPDAPMLFKGEVPLSIGDDSGSDSGDYELLGRFVRYCEQTFELRALRQAQHSPADWGELLREQLLNVFFADSPAWPELRRERDAVAQLVEDFVNECREAGSAASIPFTVLRDALLERATETTRMAARLADGVTIGQLASGQIYPAAVICAIGMNDGAFPRHPPRQTFDLVDADERRLGDRDLRDEDRFAFLEALLAARRCFVVTYTGRDLREDSAIPPSLVVTELQQYLAARFAGETPPAFATQHPLQPFSRRYFSTEDDLYSYSPAMAQAAATLTRPSRELPDRFAGTLPADEVDEVDEKVALDDLVRFAVAPVRHFVEKRLGMTLRLDSHELDDEETLELDGRGRWALRNELFKLQEAGVEEAVLDAVLRAKGHLPEGNVGRVQYGASARQVALLTTALRPCAEHLNAPPVEVDVRIDDKRLTGIVPHFLATQDELLFWRVGDLRERDRITAWLRLLAVCCQTRRPAQALLIGLVDDVRQMQLQATPEMGDAALPHWLAAWRQGRRQPLPFFPATSWAWIAADNDRQAAAQKTWLDHRGSGDGADEYNQLVFPQAPFSENFEHWATCLLAPLKDGAL